MADQPRRRSHAETGVSAVEYALLISMVAGLIFVIVTIFGTSVGQLFTIQWWP
ncbi:Flp family type IVb pilin [Nocardioides piscis]|uniref:Flp family type IVb pilin n=1 Tax=Nocardioides piscis TaxID=2714938 RepID=A0A6G7YJI0_9ACTN|nr:Flp family type IVb pilin [Nocardioides piscis]QIK76890.1 Flp family type IVb pilin [Nocardioides piscis]